MDSKPTPRVERLRERFFDYKRTLNLDRIRIYTQSFRETEGEPMVIRRAKAFAKVVRELPCHVYTDELILGHRDVIPRGCSLHIDWSGPLIERDLDSLRTRASDPYVLTEEDERELREQIIPYWKGDDGKYKKTVNWRVYDLYTQDLKEVMFVDADEYPPRGTGILSQEHRLESDAGHIAFPDEVLATGFVGVKRRAEEQLARLDLTKTDDLRKVPFLRAVIIALGAAAELGARFAAKAREVAATVKDRQGRAELLKIAEVCDQVPAGPARTFHEAIQASWFYKVLARIETPDYCNGPGAPDRWLWPYYQRDIKEGRLTKAETQELIDCWFIKFAEANHYYSNMVVQWYPGCHPFQVFTCGGVGPDGKDVTNELSYMIVEAMMHTRLFQPTLGVRLHSQTPEPFLLKCVELVAMGTGNPSFVNDEAVIPGLLSVKTGSRDAPITPEVARAYTPAGCVEATVPGHYGTPTHCFVNYPGLLELALNNGVSRIHGKRIGLETADPRKFQSFDEVVGAFMKQLAYFMRLNAAVNNVTELVEAELFPTPFQSAFIDDCIERGLSKEQGGARYNFGGTGELVGLGTCADSLAAIKKVVFDDKAATMAQLIDALDANFEGYDDLRRRLLDAPKFGNDDDYVDQIAAWLSNTYVDGVGAYQNTRGGYFVGGAPTVGTNVPFGLSIGATPDGRKATAILSNGISPTDGVERKGLTAVFNSMGKIDFVKQWNTIWNLRLDPNCFVK